MALDPDAMRQTPAEIILEDIRQFRRLEAAYPGLSDEELAFRMVESKTFVAKTRRYLK